MVFRWMTTRYWFYSFLWKKYFVYLMPSPFFSNHQTCVWPIWKSNKIYCLTRWLRVSMCRHPFLFSWCVCRHCCRHCHIYYKSVSSLSAIIGVSSYGLSFSLTIKPVWILWKSNWTYCLTRWLRMSTYRHPFLFFGAAADTLSTLPDIFKSIFSLSA